MKLSTQVTFSTTAGLHVGHAPLSMRCLVSNRPPPQCLALLVDAACRSLCSQICHRHHLNYIRIPGSSQSKSITTLKPNTTSRKNVYLGAPCLFIRVGRVFVWNFERRLSRQDNTNSDHLGRRWHRWTLIRCSLGRASVSVSRISRQHVLRMGTTIGVLLFRKQSAYGEQSHNMGTKCGRTTPTQTRLRFPVCPNVSFRKRKIYVVSADYMQ